MVTKRTDFSPRFGEGVENSINCRHVLKAVLGFIRSVPGGLGAGSGRHRRYRRYQPSATPRVMSTAYNSKMISGFKDYR